MKLGIEIRLNKVELLFESNRIGGKNHFDRKLLTTTNDVDQRNESNRKKSILNFQIFNIKQFLVRMKRSYSKRIDFKKKKPKSIHHQNRERDLDRERSKITLVFERNLTDRFKRA